MDLNDIWQEHRVWILGVLAGVILFFIGNGMISRTYDIGALKGRMRANAAKIRKVKRYGKPALNAARAEQRKLDQALAAAKERCYFRPRERFDLEGKGDPSIYYLNLTSKTKSEVQDSMDAMNIEFRARNLGLPAKSPTDRETTERTLYGLDMVQDLLGRLLEVSDRVLQDNPDRLGLRSVEKISIRSRQAKGRERGRRKRDSIQENSVAVRLELLTDAPTLELFLESLNGTKEGQRPLLFSELRAQTGSEPEDPLRVKFDFLALLGKWD
ncbi:MAG: hypothetical protein ACE5F1_18805 [Planctomycetota bacterium]